jgi:hypothetical protein
MIQEICSGDVPLVKLSINRMTRKSPCESVSLPQNATVTLCLVHLWPNIRCGCYRHI